MLDIKLIRENPEILKNGLARRGQDVKLEVLMAWDGDRRKLIAETNALQEQRNKASEEVGKLKKAKQEPTPQLLADINAIRDKIKEQELRVAAIDKHIEDFLLRLPNIPDDTTPNGKDEKDNVVVRQHGEIPAFAFAAKPHWEIGEGLGILDFNTAAKISGARFSLLKGQGCLLERALITFMLDTHRAAGFTEVMTPYLVNRASMQGTGQLPKFEEELFRCKDDELYLIPTAEVSVTNMLRDEMLPEKDLPKYFVSYSACFRREAGSYGKDTRGLIRNHQFNKVELVKFVKPEDSAAELETLTAQAASVLEKLGLTYRVVALCSGDIGFSSAKTYDLEVWMPGENRWREISSCSNFKDFQARRMNIKFKRETNAKEFAHTLNGSGVAIGRTFAAVLERYQNADGSVTVPPVLREYMKCDVIKK